MGLHLDSNSIIAILSQPNPDGSYPTDLGSYLADVSGRRRVVLLSFPPKCGGTFLRASAVYAVDGHLYRACYAQGGREAQFYLPVFLKYYLDDTAPNMVTHVHMQALPGNCNFIRALNLKPVTMLRSISDMLVSYHDMFLHEDGMLLENVSCKVPNSYPGLSQKEQADFLIYMMAPWYVAYYGSWIEYAASEPERVLVLNFKDLHNKPTDMLYKIMTHSGFDCDEQHCQRCVDMVWQKKDNLRYNKGVSGRGRDFFLPQHFAHLEKLLSQYPVLKPYREELL